MKRSSKKATKTVAVCACVSRTKGKPHRAPCPLTGKYAGRKQPSRPMTPKQVEQRKAFDARRIVPPESIANEIKALVAHVTAHPCDGEQIAKRLRDVFPFAFRDRK